LPRASPRSEPVRGARHRAAPGAAPGRGEQQHPRLAAAAGQAHPALIKQGIIRTPALQHPRCLTADSHPYGPARGDPGVLRALLEGGRLRPSQEQAMEEAPDQAEKHPTPRATGKGWAAGVPSEPRGADRITAMGGEGAFN